MFLRVQLKIAQFYVVISGTEQIAPAKRTAQVERELRQAITLAIDSPNASERQSNRETASDDVNRR